MICMVDLEYAPIACMPRCDEPKAGVTRTIVSADQSRVFAATARAEQSRGATICRRRPPVQRSGSPSTRGSKTLALLTPIAFLSILAFARAAVAPIDLKSLVERSDLIVMAVVTKVEDGSMLLARNERDLPPLKVATARVVEYWKGCHVHEVRFWGSPTRPCDLAGASEGEELILFLERSTNSGVMKISHVGRGRMLLQGVKNERSADVDEYIELPPIKEVSKRLAVRKCRFPILNKPGEPRFVTLSVEHMVQTIQLGALRDLVRVYVTSARSADLASVAAVSGSGPLSTKCESDQGNRRTFDQDNRWDVVDLTGSPKTGGLFSFPW